MKQALIRAGGLRSYARVVRLNLLIRVLARAYDRIMRESNAVGPESGLSSCTDIPSAGSGIFTEMTSSAGDSAVARTTALNEGRGSAGQHRLAGQHGVARISVVMCTFNGEAFVRQQLESILGQVLPPIEVIVSDDGSTDRTLAIIDSVAQTSSIEIRVHVNPHRLGFSENFLQACTYACGDYVAFSDQDDVWLPEKLKVTREAMLATGARLGVHGVDKIDADGIRIESRRRASPGRAVLDSLCSHPWGNFLGFTMLFERSLLSCFEAGSRGKDPHAHGSPLSHDRWVYFLAATFGRIVVLDDVLAFYRQHGSQLYGATKGRSLRERATTKLANGQRQAAYLADLAEYRAYMLEELLVVDDSLSEGQKTSAIAGVTWWRKISSHMDGSARLYACTSVGQRMHFLLRNVLRGGYRSFGHGGLGSRRLVEDVTMLVVMSASRYIDRENKVVEKSNDESDGVLESRDR